MNAIDRNTKIMIYRHGEENPGIEYNYVGFENNQYIYRSTNFDIIRLSETEVIQYRDVYTHYYQTQGNAFVYHFRFEKQMITAELAAKAHAILNKGFRAESQGNNVMAEKYFKYATDMYTTLAAKK